MNPPLLPLVLFSVLTVVSLAVTVRLRLIAGRLPIRERGDLGYLALAFVLGLGAWILVTPIAVAALSAAEPKPAQPASATTTVPATSRAMDLETTGSQSSASPTTANANAASPSTVPARRPASVLTAHPLASVAGTIIGFGVGAMVMAAIRPLAFPRVPGRVGPSLTRQVSLGIAGFVLAWPPVMLLGDLTVRLLRAVGSDVPTAHDLITLLRDPARPNGTVALVVISAAIGAPLFEETLFRGHLQPLLVNLFSRATPRLEGEPERELRWARFGGILVTSLMFAGLHPPFSIPAIFVLSLALGLLYERTGRLLPCIIAHVAFNGTQLAFALLVP